MLRLSYLEIRSKSPLCQCSFELHFISTFIPFLPNARKIYSVNALPSSTSFLPHPFRTSWFTRLSEACFAGICQNILINSPFQGVFMSWQNFSCISTSFCCFSIFSWNQFCPLFYHYKFFSLKRQAEFFPNLPGFIMKFNIPHYTTFSRQTYILVSKKVNV